MPVVQVVDPYKSFVLLFLTVTTIKLTLLGITHLRAMSILIPLITIYPIINIMTECQH